jgi:acyl-CoA thioesterase FadM
VVVRLYLVPAARLEFAYQLVSLNDGEPLAQGRTVQAFVGLDRQLLLTQPELMRQFHALWEHLAKVGDE